MKNQLGMQINQGYRLKIILPTNEFCKHNKDTFEIILCHIHVTELLVNQCVHKLPKQIFLPLGKKFGDIASSRQKMTKTKIQIFMTLLCECPN